MNKNNKILILLLCVSFIGNAQKRDTIQITSEYINTKVLREGTHRYLVYFKMKKDAPRTQTQFWTRTISRTVYNGKPCIEINQEWEDKDSIMHVVKSISDAETMQPMYHRTWWKVQRSRAANTKTVSETIVDFSKKKIEYNGKQVSDADSIKQVKKIWEGYQSSVDKYFLNWHLDLEVFPLLPFKEGVTFVIPFYDPGTGSSFQQVAYTVMGSGELVGYNDQKIDCWLMSHEERGNKEIFWISKKTREVLKLEQEINGSLYRYKIKLGFSI
ncbi:MAG TPA: hypothetical protein PLM56_06005 [Cyclobacteriaceae bacterium]|jgi:hypothetical protein|nr:hypothetical protein [Cytophagales bacterium]HCR54017.1 hypothetical protein [Cytophagales bacterium]HRE67361.1 hypothetical protein [Cyclobacteriaceae bacterium]HRF33030.1 hypothetical protein [Cyclobacteriaceae bacterium]